MSAPPPIGFQSIPGGRMCFDPQRVAQPTEELFDPDSPLLKAVPVSVGGRKSAWFVTTGFGAGVLRHYRRGGLVARVSRDRYIWTGAASTRSFAEFAVLQYLHNRGLRVPAPLAGAYWRAGLTYRAALLIEEITGVHTLAQDRQAAPAVARAVFDMHQAGVWHADLNAWNILLDEAGQVWLIDFDRARRLDKVPARMRRSNLLRLRRSLLKVAGESARPYWEQLCKEYMQLNAARGTEVI